MERATWLFKQFTVSKDILPTSPRGNPWVRILLSFLLLASVGIYVWNQQRPADGVRAPRQPLPAGSPLETASQRFSWIPRYESAEINDIHSQQLADEVSYGFSFEVKTGFEPVLSFYENHFRSAGFVIDKKNAGEFGSSVRAQSPDGKRQASVRGGKLGDRTIIEVLAVEKIAG